MNSIERLHRAKIYLMIEQPFFGQLLYFQLRHLEEVKTMAVDNSSVLYYSEEFVNECDKGELVYTLCHEILHLAYLHTFRMKNRIKRIWNIAADLKVNDDLESLFLRYSTKRDFIVKAPSISDLIPKYHDWEFGKIKIIDIDKKTTEQIYNELLKHAAIINAISLNEDLKESDSNEKDLKQSEYEWRARVMAAQALGKGDTPMGLAIELKSLEQPIVRWSQVLYQRFKSKEKIKSWRKINKKMLPWYFPGSMKAFSIKAVFAMDTSGSMSKEQLDRALTEIIGFARQFRLFEFYVMTCDAEVHDILRIKGNSSYEQLKKFIAHGRGGTVLTPLFKEVKKKFNDNIDCLIIFSDLYAAFPEKQPSYDVYWVTDSSNGKVPFGRIINI